MKFRLLILAAASLLVLAGCAKTVDTSEAEKQIKKDVSAAGVNVEKVECPDVDAEKGKSFDCDVTIDGEKQKLKVDQKDDEGNLEYDPSALVAGAGGAAEPGAEEGGDDEAAVKEVVDAVNADIKALCENSTEEYKALFATDAGAASCEDAVAEEEDDPIEDPQITVEGDTATVTGTDSNGERTVTLERQEDGSWLVSLVE